MSQGIVIIKLEDSNGDIIIIKTQTKIPVNIEQGVALAGIKRRVLVDVSRALNSTVHVSYATEDFESFIRESKK